MKTFVIGNRLYLGSLILSSEPVKIEHFAILPNQDHSSHPVWIHDWKGDGENVFVSYSYANGNYAAIIDSKLAYGREEIQLKAPKGKGWEWQDGRWIRYTRKGREESQPV